MGIHIVTDSSSDLRLDYVKENEQYLTVLGMPIELDGKGYVDDLGETFSKDFFYEKLRAGAFPSTSQISPVHYLDMYKKALENGDDVIVIGLSSGLSSTINGAILAMEQTNSQYSDNQVTVIDTLAGSIGLGYLVYCVVEKVKAGIDTASLIQWIEDNKLSVNHWFAIDDLMHLKKGGRIPPTMAYVGTMLKVKPILTIFHDGKLGAYTKIRGRNKSIQFLLTKLETHLKDEKGVVMLGHADCMEDAALLKMKITERFPEVTIISNRLSQTIATHVGPGMLAVAFLGKEIRENQVQ